MHITSFKGASQQMRIRANEEIIKYKYNTLIRCRDRCISGRLPFCSICPQKSFVGLQWPKFVKCASWVVKNAQMWREKSFAPKCPQKSFGGLPWPTFAKFAYFRSQKCPFWRSKMPTLQNNCFSSKCPHDRNVQYLHIWGLKCPFGVKNAKLWKKGFVPNAPQSYLSNDQNLHFLWAKNPPKKKKKLQKNCSYNFPPKSFVDVQWPNCLWGAPEHEGSGWSLSCVKSTVRTQFMPDKLHHSEAPNKHCIHSTLGRTSAHHY